MITTNENPNLAELAHIPLKRPAKAGEHWRGMKHADLVESVLQSGNNNFHIKAVHVDLSETELAAAFSVDIPESKKWVEAKNITFGLGLRTSNARRCALRFYAGGWVESDLWSTPVVLSEIHVRRHQSMKLGVGMESALVEWLKEALKLPAVVAIWKKSTLDYFQVAVLLSKVGRCGIIPWSRIGEVDDCLSDAVVSKWDFMVALAEQIKRSPPLTQQSQLLLASQLLRE